MEIITSQANPLIKNIKRLARRPHREKENKFLIEGARFVEEALNSDWPLEAVLYTSEFYLGHGNVVHKARSKRLKVVEVTGGLLAELAETENPQGVAAVAHMRQWGITGILAAVSPGDNIIVLVDGVQDPGNLGTLIRSADAFGAGGVILTKGTVDLYNPKTLRSTMGSIFHLPVVQGLETKEIICLLREHNYTLVVGDPRAELSIDRADLLSRIALVVGSEASGPSREVMSHTHTRVSIPMPGKAESLNVGVASAIMLYEVTRQRRNGGGA